MFYTIPFLLVICLIVYISGEVGIIDLFPFMLHKGEYFSIHQLLTYSFLHGSILHLIMNGILLYQIHNLFGYKESNYKMLFFWIFLSIISGLFSIIFETSSVVGASGVGLGLITYFYLKYRDIPNVANSLVPLLIMNIGIGFFPGISLWGHIGGVIGGYLLYIIFNKK